MEKSQLDVFTMVPSYNHGRFIGKCLRSIIDQSIAPKKLLVIDDGSTDGSPKIIADVLKDCPFPSELIARENRGLCGTLNQALSLADGKYFAYLGADDFWLPTFLEERFKMMENKPDAVMGFGHAYIVNADDEIIGSTSKHTKTWANYYDGDSREMLLNGISPMSSTVFYRRSGLKTVNWNESSRLEDFEMYIKLLNLGDFAFDPQILSVWREHTYNASKDLEMMLREILATQDRNLSELRVSREEINRRQTRIKFRYARKLLQHGEKGEAFRLAKANWRGAGSVVEFGSFVLRMALPMSIVELKRNLRNGKPVSGKVSQKSANFSL